MNKVFKTMLLALGVVVVLAGAFAAGAWAMRGASSGHAAGQAVAARPTQGGFPQERQEWMAGRGRDGAFPPQGGGPGAMMDGDDDEMPGPRGNGRGMGAGPRGPWGGAYGSGGMMGSYGADPAAQPLTLEAARQAVEAYVQRLNNPNLEIREVMVFSNQAYAEIAEKDTGIGAMEVLVDPASRRVFPEPGPNMMWNLKYGPHADGASGAPAEMPIQPAEARQLAQKFLDRNAPGLQVSQDADPFYGYYTLHTLKDGQVVGMLSVNGYTGEVFLHTWHGKFITMSGEGGQ